jgi:membrane protease YdiL (CAAX protease family)
VPAHVPRTVVRTGRGRIDVGTAVAVWATTWVAGLLLFQLVASTSGDTSGDATLPISTLAPAVVATWFAHLAGLWYASERVGSQNFVADYGLRFELIDIVGIPIGLLSQLVLVPLVYVPLRAWWPDTFSDDRLEETARDLVDRADGAAVVLLVFVVVVGAPIVEELVYRGLLQGSFVTRISELPALLAAASWFAIIHLRPVEYPGLFVAGLVFGMCAITTGRLGMSIVTHAAFNATGLLTVMSSR